MTLLGEDSWMFAPGFLWNLPHAPFFPFADFALNPFTVINLRHESDAFYESSYQITECEGGLGTPNTTPKMCISFLYKLATRGFRYHPLPQ